MSGWLIFLAYIAAWLISGTLLAQRILIGIERGKRELYPEDEDHRYSPGWAEKHRRIEPGDRSMAALSGYAISLVVPVLPVLLIRAYDVVTERTNLLRTPNEVAEERAARGAAELAAYRKLAREHGLLAPEVPK